jgi:hypothetical protein
VQPDRHRLVRDPEHRARISFAAPAEALEEAHVRDLDLRDHQAPAELAGGGHGEAHEHRAEVRRALGRKDGEPVALPQSFVIERVEAHGPDDLPARQADGVPRRGVVVAAVAVVVLEDLLRLDEHLPPDREVPFERDGVARERALQRDLAVVRKP